MARPDRLRAEVLIAAENPPEQQPAIVEAFGALGVAARVRTIPARRAVADFQWLLLAVLPLQAFLSTLGSTLAGEASQALKRLVGRAHQSRPEATSRRPVLVLQDATTRLQVVLEASLPAEAHEALLSLDLSNFHKGPLHYDRYRGVWRSELDESQRRHDSPPENSRDRLECHASSRIRLRGQLLARARRALKLCSQQDPRNHDRMQESHTTSLQATGQRPISATTSSMRREKRLSK